MLWLDVLDEKPLAEPINSQMIHVYMRHHQASMR